jgi:pSer/pThr/pTyr-binding forkhead associated (FHA) protein
MNVRLIVEQGAKRGSFSFSSSIAVIGRSKGNAVRIPSADVSRRHCRLRTQDDRLWVEDLGSVNGTLLNGKRINGIEWVRPGDELTVGPVTFVVEYETGEEVLEADEIEVADEVIEEVQPPDEDAPLPADDDLLPAGFELDEEGAEDNPFRDLEDS